MRQAVPVVLPALWALKYIDPLSNPNPSDIEVLDQHPVIIKGTIVDHGAETKRPKMKRHAQE